MNSLTALRRWALETEGSTRPAALIRISLSLLIWARFGSEVALYHNPNWLRVALICVFTPSTLAMMVGWKTRWSTSASALVLASMFVYGVVNPGQSGWSSHHIELLTSMTILCAFMPSGRSYSVDRWIAVRKAAKAVHSAPPERGNLWAQRLIVLQMVAIYFWAAVEKLTPAYFDGSALESLFMSYYRLVSYPEWPPGFHALCLLAAWGTVATEFFLSFALLVNRLRPWAILIGIIFHGIIYLTIPVATFTMTMFAGYLAALDPDRVHRFLDQIQSPLSPAMGATPSPPNLDSAESSDPIRTGLS